nr:type IV pilus assembly ATPase TfpB-like [Nerophis lumbriciformis]
METDVTGVTALFSQAYARQHHILPVGVDADRAVIATSEPFQLGWVQDLRHVLRTQIKVVIADPVDIRRYQTEFYNVSRSVQGANRLKKRSDTDIQNFEQLVELGNKGELNADDQHVVHIVDWLLQYAFEQRASDIHLEPRRERGNVRFRIDGKLHQVYQMPTPVMAAVTSRIKILGRMDLAEKRRPQDGRMKTRRSGGAEVELRLSTMPTAFGEKCVMRIFDPEMANQSFDGLGFSAPEAESWRKMVERSQGLVLVTGPTGSGKTTTLYTTLKMLASPDINVCTVEDPIEMVAPEFNQMQVQTKIGVNFGEGVRTLLRQDPDVIMIGEIRDLETAEMAIQASLTGHLVISTLHTNDAPSSIVRLLDLGVPHYLLRGTLVGIVAQRLARTLCPHCKAPAAIDPLLWQSLVQDWPLPLPSKGQNANGCLKCRETGYLGRTAIYEMLEVNDEITAALDAEINPVALTRLGYQHGLRPLRIAAALKVNIGITTATEALRVTPPAIRRQ